jgi:hypothetical protein
MRNAAGFCSARFAPLPKSFPAAHQTIKPLLTGITFGSNLSKLNHFQLRPNTSEQAAKPAPQAESDNFIAHYPMGMI